MKATTIFIPITKVDTEKRLVFGTLAQETPDHANEVLDYDSSKKYFSEWSEGFKKATDGKSAGNLRAMHQPIAAGKFVSVEANDETKAFDVCAKVTSDQEWKNVTEGVYTGFSIGGKYLKRWVDPTDNSLTRYTAKPAEGSLVDAPCIPTATFTAIKADGTSEICKFQQTNKATVTKVAIDSGVLTFRAAFTAAYNAIKGGVGKIRERVEEIAAAKGLKKGMWDVADLACALASINRIRMSTKWEAAYEDDGSDVPERLRTWIDEGVQILKDLLDEEAGELTADPPISDENYVLLAQRVDELAKSMGELPTRITALLSTSAPGRVSGVAESGSGESAVGAVSKSNNEVIPVENNNPNGAPAADLTKAATLGEIQKLFAPIAEVQKTQNETIKKQGEQLADLAGAVAAITEGLTKALGAPEPAAVVTNAGAAVAVTKEADAAGGVGGMAQARSTVAKSNGVDDRDAARDEFKKAFQYPRALDPSDPRFPKSA